jgi:hypothetical protein
MNHPNHRRKWLMLLPRVFILCQPLGMALARLQNQANHRRLDVQSTHQAMQDSPLCDTRVLVEITCAGIICTTTHIH